MSHLDHINNYKIALIKEGVTDPETQIALVRTAYSCAFIRLFTQKNIPVSDRTDVMHYLLSYWNETFPVNGNFVISNVNGFYERLNSTLSNIRATTLLPITRDPIVEKHPLYYDVEGYDQLVETLVTEATHKYNQRLKG